MVPQWMNQVVEFLWNTLHYDARVVIKISVHIVAIMRRVSADYLKTKMRVILNRAEFNLGRRNVNFWNLKIVLMTPKRPRKLLASSRTMQPSFRYFLISESSRHICCAHLEAFSRKLGSWKEPFFKDAIQRGSLLSILWATRYTHGDRALDTTADTTKGIWSCPTELNSHQWQLLFHQLALEYRTATQALYVKATNIS